MLKNSLSDQSVLPQQAQAPPKQVRTLIRWGPQPLNRDQKRVRGVFQHAREFSETWLPGNGVLGTFPPRNVTSGPYDKSSGSWHKKRAPESIIIRSPTVKGESCGTRTDVLRDRRGQSPRQR